MNRWKLVCPITFVASALAVFPAAAQFSDATTPPLNNAKGNIGSALADYDADGDLDIAVGTFSGAEPCVQLYRNDGPSFAATTANLGPTPRQAPGVSWGDFDDDGDLDLVASGGTTGGGYYFRNNGDGTFTDIGDPTFVPVTGGRTIPSADFDLDGDLDLYVAETGANSRLLRNNNGSFQDVTPAFLDVSTQTASWGDYDNDGDPDLFLGTSPGILARNNGNSTFSDVTVAAGVSLTGGKLSTAWGDFNNDGNLDLFQGSNGGISGLFRNNGNGTFSNVTPAPMAAAFSGAGATWFDFDNDTDLDLFHGGYFGAGSRLFRNDTGGVFNNIFSGPIAAINVDEAPAGDLDGDGDLDLFISNEGSTDRLFRNDTPAGAHWLHVTLAGTVSNFSGIGAKVTVVSGGVTQVRDASGGGGWSGQSALPVEFGLGASTLVNTLSVQWPSGQSQILTNVPVDRKMTITEPGFSPVAALAGGFAPGQPFDLTVDTFGANVTTATLFFRAAGTSTFSSGATMTIDAVNDRMTAAVSSVNASENGVEYFILYRMNNGSTRSFPRNGATTPAFLPANLGTRPQPAAAPANEHVLFAVPFAATNASLSGVLEDDLGAYDNKKWRFGRFSPSAGTYLEAGSAGALSPGRGFWLIEKNPVAVDATGVSNNTVGGTSIPVDPGWNQIGHPYLFNVPTSQVDRSDAPNVTNRFVSRVGGAYQDVTTLEPWKGYWVFNGGTGTQTIVVPGQIGLSPAPPESRRLEDQLDWQIAVAARSGTSADRGNVAGVTSDSNAAELSLPEPPGLPGTVRVSFTRADGATRDWSTDVRASGGSSESFELVVEAPAEETVVTFEGLSTLPGSWKALLLNEASLAAIDVTETTVLSLPSSRTHRFRLVVGNETAIEAARSGLDRTPASVLLATPHPNPFTSEAKIAFALPRQSAVDLAIYDVSGRLVRRLVDGNQAAGIHRLEWNGTDGSGAKASAGVYFAKLVASGEEKTEKIVFLK